MTKITKIAGGREIEKNVGPKCDACYRCSVGFPMLEWGALCDLYHSDKDFKEEFDAAAKVLNGAAKEFQAATAQGGVEHAIDLTQKFTLVTERQLAHLSQRSRLPKTIVRHVPFVMLPSEIGGKWDKYYVFRGKVPSYRIMSTRQALATTMSTVALDPLAQIRPRQCAEVLERGLQKQNEVSGLREMLEKSQDFLRTLDEFLPKLKAPTTAKRNSDGSEHSEELDDKQSDEDANDAEGGTVLRGSAASSLHNMPPPIEPSPLKRLRSSVTLGRIVTVPAHVGSSDAGSTIDGNDEDASDADGDWSGDACVARVVLLSKS